MKENFAYRQNNSDTDVLVLDHPWEIVGEQDQQHKQPVKETYRSNATKPLSYLGFMRF